MKMWNHACKCFKFSSLVDKHTVSSQANKGAKNFERNKSTISLIWVLWKPEWRRRSRRRTRWASRSPASSSIPVPWRRLGWAIGRVLDGVDGDTGDFLQGDLCLFVPSRLIQGSLPRKKPLILVIAQIGAPLSLFEKLIKLLKLRAVEGGGDLVNVQKK